MYSESLISIIIFTEPTERTSVNPMSCIRLLIVYFVFFSMAGMNLAEASNSTVMTGVDGSNADTNTTTTAMTMNRRKLLQTGVGGSSADNVNTTDTVRTFNKRKLLQTGVGGSSAVNVNTMD